MIDISSNKCELESVAKAICQSNQFKYERFIDAGSYKETYQVNNGTENYALKVFKPNNSSERTEKEIDAMRRINCPNVAKLINVDSFDFNNNIYLYLLEEYFAGGSLSSLMINSTLSKPEIISLGSDLISALESTYKERIVHRDIKPDNIMFRGNCAEAVLIDFGLVRDLNATSITQTFLMRGPGTALYSAPEQLNNNKSLIDWRTDQFALGITLCTAIFGVHPFEASSPTKTVEKIASLEKCNDDTIDKLAALGLSPLIKMLEPYPVRRYRMPQHLRSDWGSLEGII